MGFQRTVLVLLGMTACGSPEPPPTFPLQARATPPTHQAAIACVTPMDDGRARLGDSQSVLEPIDDPPDLDGDGNPDVILRNRGSREPTHLLYVTSKKGCSRFVGRIEAFMLDCDDQRHGGLCDMSVDTWLMHGDRLRTRWVFDGTTYQPFGDGELVPGPRKH